MASHTEGRCIFADEIKRIILTGFLMTSSAIARHHRRMIGKLQKSFGVGGMR